MAEPILRGIEPTMQPGMKKAARVYQAAFSQLSVPAESAAAARLGNINLDAAVARTAAIVVVRGDRLAFAAAFDRDAGWIHAAPGQVVAGARRAVDRQRLVHAGGAGGVGMADDDDVGGRILVQGGGE